jgi:hypothetical protein
VANAKLPRHAVTHLHLAAGRLLASTVKLVFQADYSKAATLDVITNVVVAEADAFEGCLRAYWAADATAVNVQRLPLTLANQHAVVMTNAVADC